MLDKFGSNSCATVRVIFLSIILSTYSPRGGLQLNEILLTVREFQSRIPRNYDIFYIFVLWLDTLKFRWI